MPKQRKYQPSLQEPKAKTEEAERGSKRLALSIGRESVDLLPSRFVSTIHKRFHREIKDRNRARKEQFWFRETEEGEDMNVIVRAEGRRCI
ncbi:unnamed protein product [Eruca vesicaria subsp. sativa]|uniref:Uncharacterized protein n=1 Tax=Eruca vesicaria subsp. sativa TaxID=29727 RepID=A0ABC8ISB7_ERUVS|nr:unnamed protein product [Eruca vesicaria subsp. sativa]